MDVLLLLASQADTATTVAVGSGAVESGVLSIISAFGRGALEGLGAMFAFVALLSRVKGLERRLAPTAFDWLVWVLRAVGTLGSATVAAVLARPDAAIEAALGGLVGALPLAWRSIRRAIEEATD